MSIGGDEKVVTVWGKKAGADPRNPLSWSSIWSMKDAHPATINYLTTFKGVTDSDLYFATMCSDGVLKLWAGAADGDQVTFALKSELLFGRNLQEVTELLKFGENDLLLLTGGYDSKIHVYMTELGPGPSELKYQFSMAGHFNSIKSLSFSPTLA